MSRTKLLVIFISGLAFSRTPSLLLAQTSSAGMEQQLRSLYQLTRVGTNGRVVGQAGSVLVMQEDGLTAIPASYNAYWYNTLKKDGRIKPNAMQHVGSHFHDAMGDRRPLQVGEQLYLTNMEVAPTEIVFYVQSCGACAPSVVDPNDVPYRARLAFQFDKGYLSTADSKQVLGRIARVFGVGASPPKPDQPQPPPSPAPPGPAPGPDVLPGLPSIYVKAQTPADQLQLNADNTFSLQEAGQTYNGTFVATGSTLKLNISGGPETTATIQGSNLTDGSGQTWVRREQTAPGAPAATVLQNQDVIKMVKAGLDDALIIAKIGSSKCQFDTSTDALIQLKQSGVSAAVLKVIVSGK